MSFDGLMLDVVYGKDVFYVVGCVFCYVVLKVEIGDVFVLVGG